MSRRVFSLLGSPVHHSVSPALYRAAFRELGIEASYHALDVGPEEFGGVMRAAAERGGGNVTAPHKERAMEALDLATEAVRATGACNCFWTESPQDGDAYGDEGGRSIGGEQGLGETGTATRRAGLLAGDNTDVEGFLEAVDALPLEGGLEGARVLVLGAGGAARAVVHACLRAGARAVDVRNRTPARAEAMVGQVAAADPRARALPWDGRAVARYRLAVNATPLGRNPADPGPPDAEKLGASAALDLVYASGGTAWARRAAARGLPAADGLEMLVRQAARSLQRWFPGVEPPLEAMRTAARRALAERAPRGTGVPGGTAAGRSAG